MNSHSREDYVEACGEMTVRFVVEMPRALCHESVACEDPAIEAAMQAVLCRIDTFIWGANQPPAVVSCDVCEADVMIEDDERETE